MNQSTQIDTQVYEVSQVLIEIGETLGEAMAEQNIDIAELSYRTKLEERVLEDCLQNYADVKIGILIRIATALGKTIDVRAKDAKL